MKLSQRVLSIEESITVEAATRAMELMAEGHDVLSLTLGEPDFATPKNIQEAATKSIEDGSASFYTASSGLPALKKAIIQHIETFYGYTLAPNQVVAGTGAKFILYAFFQAVLDPGDEVLIPTPYWVSYQDQIKMSDGQPVFIESSEANDFKITVDQLEAALTDKTKILLLNSPSNPTGMIYSVEELEAIGNWAVAKGILILADDIYGRLVYNGNRFTPISSLSEAIRQQTIVVNGVSKAYSMTGWRMGYAAGDSEIIAAMAKIIGQTTSSLTTATQYACIEALTGDQDTVEVMRQAFEERLNTIYPLLAQIPGFKVIKPQGAFYLFPNVAEAMKMKGFTDVTTFTSHILEQTGVALVTGAGFGAPENVRLSYATDLDTLKEAVQRLKTYMSTD